MKFQFFILLAALSAGGPAFAESFSCPIGRRGACLDYGDKVVSSDALCFSRMTCDYEGFVCKSTLTEFLDKAKKIAGGYDDLYNCVARAPDMTSVGSAFVFTAPNSSAAHCRRRIAKGGQAWVVAGNPISGRL